MKTYKPMAGENVSETAKRMVALAKKTKKPVTAKFNDIALTAKPGDDPDAIVKYYQTESNRRLIAAFKKMTLRYGCVMSTLSQAWIHGEQLRR